MRFQTPIFLVVMASILLGCGDQQISEIPKPREVDADATGYYCHMTVADHLGPKGQIFLEGQEAPIWFTSARDTLAFTMLPEEPKNIAAIYVNDAGATDWDHPAPGTWIDAREAWYVIGSSKVGGMGAPEAAPFGDQAGAEAFAASHGGQVVKFADVPRDYVLGAGGP